MKESITKWIFASVGKHFEDRKQNLFLNIEGQHRTTNTQKDWAELRIDGPYLTEISRNLWHFDIEVNTLVLSTIDDRDAYRYLKNVGIMLKAFTRTIDVFRYGTDIEDDGSYVGCLVLKQEYRDKLVVSHFGLTAPDTKIRQSQIEGHYRMEYNGLVI